MMYFCSFIKHFIKHFYRKRDAFFAWLALRLFNVQFAENAQEPINYALPAATRQNVNARRDEMQMQNVGMGNVKCEKQQFYIILNDRQLLFLVCCSFFSAVAAAALEMQL